MIGLARIVQHWGTSQYMPTPRLRLVNAEKSKICPVQSIIFLGERLDLVAERVYSSQDKQKTIVSVIQKAITTIKLKFFSEAKIPVRLIDREFSTASVGKTTPAYALVAGYQPEFVQRFPMCESEGTSDLDSGELCFSPSVCVVVTLNFYSIKH